MKRLISSVIMIGLMLPLAACQRDDGKAPLSISGKGFVFNYRVARATYLVTLARNAPLPDEAYAEVRYENPLGGAPIETRTKIFPFWEKIALESPAVHCVVKNRPYSIAIRIVDAAGKELQAIDTTITADLDQSILPGKPLVVGPVYTPNAEGVKPDRSADFSPETGCPASS